MASVISGFINTIRNAVYGEQVRGAIADAITQCYEDVSSPALNTAAFATAIANAYAGGFLDIQEKSTIAGMTNQKIIYRYTGNEAGYITNALYYYNGTAWVPIGSGLQEVNNTSLMTNTSVIYKYVGTQTGMVQNGIYYHDGTAWVLIYSPSTIEMDDYTKFTDLFGEGTNGVVPQKPQHFVQQGGQYPTFGYALSLEQDWDIAEYNAPNVTIKTKQGSSVLVNGYAPNWKACFADLSHIKFTVLSIPYMASLAFGTDGRYLYGLYFNGKAMQAYSSSWNELTGYPNIASGKEVELWVTKTTLTCKVDGVTTDYDISSLNLSYASFGLITISSSNTNQISFENLEVGDGYYEYDNTKFLKSSGEWAVPTVTPEGFPEEFKQALLAMFRQIAYVTDEAMTYYNAIRRLLYPTQETEGWTDGEAYTDITTVVGSQINASSGVFVTAEGWSRTDFIPCQGAAYISFPELNETAMQANHAAFYNQARWRVAGITLSLSGPKDVEVPADAVFFAVSSETAALADLIEDGIVPHA